MLTACTDIIDSFADSYLLLHRENYLDEPRDIRPSIRAIARECSDGAIAELLASSNWRWGIVGLYCALCGSRVEFVGHLRTNLLRPKAPMLRRPSCLGLLLLGARELESDLLAFLQHPLSDDLGDHAAALEALRTLGGRAYLDCEARVKQALREVSLEKSALAASQARFASAVRFWREVIPGDLS